MTANWQNRTLFHGDNLPFLRAMNSESVDLIATDPPFNKGKDFHATPDSLAAGAKFQDRWSWERDVHEEWTDQITDDHPAVWAVVDWSRMTYGNDMGAFLCFMAVRLLEMKRVLKSTGSIYLHCDPTASHYLKTLMDAIFGWRNFQNELIWAYSWGFRTDKRWNKKHDVLLFYTKGKSFHFNANEVLEERRKSPETEQRLKYKGALITDGNKGRGSEKMALPSDVLYVPTINGMAKERVGYPTQKPIALYDRMLKASSNEGDIICYPFAGCATTLVAAERLNRQWVGMDIWDNAKAVVLQRLERERLALPEAERGDLFTEEIHFTVKPPERTDDGTEAAPFLRVKVRVKEPDGPKWTRFQMYEHLLEQHGPKCQGCDRAFDDPRYLELDHNTPRSDGGLNHISNRILLCGPCNRFKSNTYTLSGLKRENKKRGYMAGGNAA